MICFSDRSCWGDPLLPEEMTSRLLVKEAERAAAANGLYLAEKVFPVYAMGTLRPEFESDISVSDSSDSVWEAARKEAKSEVFIGYRRVQFSS